ncbi:SRPBCC family protein [Candidatus Leptofilum sp.]|uniref:SRPBCC family protein n=1 Tax=Candidatus Leptofilum sp. TaxID=3241576 RepID=UPI003B58EC6B
MSNIEFNLTLTQTYTASAERIFRAWIEPEALQKWFRPTNQIQVANAETDLRTGGDYRIEMQTAVGIIHRASGLYHEINEPVKLAFTWRWGDETDAEDTYVEVTLRQLAPNQTELTLFHDEFLTADERDSHEENWRGILAQLTNYLG